MDGYVYILQSLIDAERHCIGFTEDIKRRLEKHNSGQVSFTSKNRPWKLQTVIGFSDRAQAIRFEKYLKTGSGRAFAKKHF